MAHHHHHNHHASGHHRLGVAFSAGMLLNALFVVGEFIAAYKSNSLLLFSDAGHNLGDVATLGLSLLAFYLAKKKATVRFTYGYSKSTILVSLLNAVILLIAVGSIGWEALNRIDDPEAVKSPTIIVVASIGFVINIVSALFFFRDKDHDLNVKGAYLHLMADALVSLGVVVSGIILVKTGWLWLDPAVSIVIMIVVLYSAWGLLRESVRLSLDAVPVDLSAEEIKKELLSETGVKTVYHVHIWAMSTTKNALTAHLVIDHSVDVSQHSELKNRLRKKLEAHNIQHATFETDITTG